MRKKIFGAITFIAAIGGVIYMKNNPKYKEIVRVVKTADARGFYEKIILEKDKLAFTAKAKIKDYKIDYESIRNVGDVNVNIKMYKSDKIKMYNYSKLT